MRLLQKHLPVLLGTLVLGAPVIPRWPGPLQESGSALRELVVAGRGETHVRWFRLEKRGDDPAERSIPLGLLRWLSSREEATGEVRVELEWTLFEPGTRILHTEEVAPAGRKLVWRERRERTGRTLRLEGSSRRGFSSVETTGAEIHRRELSSRGHLPLLLLEAHRRGLELPARVSLLEPLSGAFETRFPRVEVDPLGVRTLRLLNPAGETVALHRFLGEEPLELGFSAGGPRALPVSEGEFEDLHRAYRQRQADPSPDAVPVLGSR